MMFRIGLVYLSLVFIDEMFYGMIMSFNTTANTVSYVM